MGIRSPRRLKELSSLLSGDYSAPAPQGPALAAPRARCVEASFKFAEIRMQWGTRLKHDVSGRYAMQSITVRLHDPC